jgi:hypothetical protein
MKITVFWVVTLYNLVSRYQRFEVTFCLENETGSIFEALVTICSTTSRRHIRDGNLLRVSLREDLKFRVTSLKQSLQNVLSSPF